MAGSMAKVGFVSLGCPKNLVDSEVMMGLLKTGGHEVTASQGEAEIIVINTCGFIESAKQESIDTILEMAQESEMLWVRVEEAHEYDLVGTLVQ